MGVLPEGLMGSCATTSGSKAEGYTEIKDKDGNLLVAFSSKDAESYWGNQYQKERVIYCMKHRRDKIPMYLRTGKKSLILRILGLRFGAWRLRKINKQEV